VSGQRLEVRAEPWPQTAPKQSPFPPALLTLPSTLSPKTPPINLTTPASFPAHVQTTDYPSEALAAMRSLLVGCVDTATDKIMELISMVAGEPRLLTDAAISGGIEIGPSGDGAKRAAPPPGAGDGSGGAARQLSPAAAGGVAAGVIGAVLLLGGGVGFAVGRKRGILLGEALSRKERPGSDAAAARAVGAAPTNGAAAAGNGAAVNLEHSLHAGNMV
jgi:hypothetical protein